EKPVFCKEVNNHSDAGVRAVNEVAEVPSLIEACFCDGPSINIFNLFRISVKPKYNFASMLVRNDQEDPARGQKVAASVVRIVFPYARSGRHSNAFQAFVFKMETGSESPGKLPTLGSIERRVQAERFLETQLPGDLLNSL